MFDKIPTGLILERDSFGLRRQLRTLKFGQSRFKALLPGASTLQPRSDLNQLVLEVDRGGLGT